MAATDVSRAILTYGGQGAWRHGIVAAEHGIVYTGKTLPTGLLQLPEMQPDSIRVVTDVQSDNFDSVAYPLRKGVYS